LKEDIRGIYDGSIFFTIAQRRDSKKTSVENFHKVRGHKGSGHKDKSHLQRSMWTSFSNPVHSALEFLLSVARLVSKTLSEQSQPQSFSYARRVKIASSVG
jgi:hypothetical protein